MASPSGLERLSPLIAAVVAGDAAAWQSFQSVLFPVLERWAARHGGMRASRLHASSDDVRDVAVSVLERIRRADFALLRGYQDRAQREQLLESWLYSELEYAVRDHRRARFGRDRSKANAEQSGTRGSKRLVNTFAARLEDEPELAQSRHSTGRFAARQIFAHIAQTFSRSERLIMQAALVRDVEKEGDDQTLALRLRRLKARLRAKFVRPG